LAFPQLRLGWDSHCHLQLDPLYDRAEECLRLASEVGVCGCLVPAFGPDQWDRQTTLLKLESIALALGIHPWCVPHHSNEWLMKKLQSGFEYYPKLWGQRLVAVGEFGLDRSTAELKGCFQVQEEIFLKHLALAEALALPVILHLVRAPGRGLELLVQSPPSNGGVLHSYSGPPDMVGAFAEVGLSFSFSGNLSYSAKARQSLRLTPHDRLLFETDGPHSKGLSAPGVLGPEKLPRVVDLASEILGRSKEWCWSVHRENCHRIFGI
jgi:TatD DNase family protein